MPGVEEFLLGEHPRTLDERYRVSIPSEFADLLTAESNDCILAKERPGCLSLWSAPVWQARLDEGMELVKQKMRAGRLQEKIAEVQLLGRLLSTRHRTVQLAGRGRLLIPEGFREFLGVEPNGETIDFRRRSVHRNMATCRMAEIPGNKDAKIQETLRPTFKITTVGRLLKSSYYNKNKNSFPGSVWERNTNYPMPGPVDFPIN